MEEKVLCLGRMLKRKIQFYHQRKTSYACRIKFDP